MTTEADTCRGYVLPKLYAAGWADDQIMTPADARRIFRQQIIWANFPSSVHLAAAEAIRDMTRNILDAVAPGERFVLGITEDVPGDVWRKSLSVILDVLEHDGRLPIHQVSAR